jgi:hypothetical protein
MIEKWQKAFRLEPPIIMNLSLQEDRAIFYELARKKLNMEIEAIDIA